MGVRDLGQCRSRVKASMTRQFVSLVVATTTTLPLYAFGASDRPVKKAEATLLDSSRTRVGTVELKQEDSVVKVKALRQPPGRLPRVPRAQDRELHGATVYF